MLVFDYADAHTWRWG